MLATPNKFVPQTAATRDAVIYQAITKKIVPIQNAFLFVVGSLYKGAFKSG